MSHWEAPCHESPAKAGAHAARKGRLWPIKLSVNRENYGETGKDVTEMERAPSGSENSTIDDSPTHVGEPG